MNGISGPNAPEWSGQEGRFTPRLRRMRALKWASIGVFCAGILSASVVIFFGAIPWVTDQTGEAGLPSSQPQQLGQKRGSGKPVEFHPRDLALKLAELDDRMVIEMGGESLVVETSIQPRLQGYVSGLLQKSQTVKAAVVVLRPTDGRILAMAGHDAEGKGGRICLEADFPAASLFKIVSAAAALERAGYTPEKTVYFDGYKYGLYKRQLKPTPGRYSNQVSFKEAFGSSINPVFGKLGIYDLGSKVISDSADRLFFNRPIPFDLPLKPSVVPVPEDDFGLAEIASGYNKRTLISPLHAALLASVAANDGVMMRPWLVQRVLREGGEVIYRGGPSKMADALGKETAGRLRVLMQETVKNGTCRRSFYRLRVNKAFQDVELGAKTGTINDITGKFRYEWLTAYAIPRNGGMPICVAVMAVHGEKAGIRAGELGRLIINSYLSS